VSVPQFSKGRRKRPRGLHKKAASPEVRRWEHEHLIPAKPEWMDADTYRKLAELRVRL